MSYMQEVLIRRRYVSLFFFFFFAHMFSLIKGLKVLQSGLNWFTVEKSLRFLYSVSDRNQGLQCLQPNIAILFTIQQAYMCFICNADNGKTRMCVFSLALCPACASPQLMDFKNTFWLKTVSRP